jgi:hypothetical protein
MLCPMRSVSSTTLAPAGKPPDTGRVDISAARAVGQRT